MKRAARTNFGHNVDGTDDFTIGVSDDGTKRIVRHDPSGETIAFGEDGFETDEADIGKLSVSDLLDGPSVKTVSDLPDPVDLSAGASV